MHGKLVSRTCTAYRFPYEGGAIHSFVCRGHNKNVEITVTDDIGNSFQGLDPEADIEIEVTFKIKPKPPTDKVITLK